MATKISLIEVPYLLLTRMKQGSGFHVVAFGTVRRFAVQLPDSEQWSPTEPITTVFADHRSVPNRSTTLAQTPYIVAVNADRCSTAVAITTFPRRPEEDRSHARPAIRSARTFHGTRPGSSRDGNLTRSIAPPLFRLCLTPPAFLFHWTPIFSLRFSS
jgi:hypothetical protein